jgi:hypothetical protein
MYSAPSSTQSGRTPDPERRFSHRRRIRGTMYIWGSRGITENLHFRAPLILYLRNDLFGEPITIHTEKANGKRATLGTLEAGEYLSIPIQDIRGVSVTCDLESTVSYILSGDPNGLCCMGLEPEHMISGAPSNDF